MDVGTKQVIKDCNIIGLDIHNKVKNAVEEIVRREMSSEEADEVFDNFIESCLYRIEEIRAYRIR